MDLVEVERKLARKAGNNARGVVGRDVFSVLHYSKTHYVKPSLYTKDKSNWQ